MGVYSIAAGGGLKKPRTIYPNMGINSPYIYGALVPIASYTANGTATGIQFSSIPQTYQDLLIVQNLRSSRGTTTEEFWQRFNNNESTDYSYTYLRGDGSSPSSVRFSNQTVTNRFDIPAGNATSGIFGASQVHILNYANTSTFKPVLVRSACDLNGSGNSNLSAGLFRSTAAITTINVATENGSNLVSGSTVILYGIRTANS
jgi:hypothetical protein